MYLQLLAAAASLYYQYKHLSKGNHSTAKQAIEEVKSVKKAKDAYDVIVVGTDPEGVAAAVSAARNGLKHAACRWAQSGDLRRVNDTWWI